METKLKELSDLIHEAGGEASVEVDYAIDGTRAWRAVAAGADVLVAGRSIFGQVAGRAAAISELRGQLELRRVQRGAPVPLRHQ
jgi:pentose-5-phosphate-3-epimerase